MSREISKGGGQEGGAVGGGHILQGNLKVGQLELGNKTRLENHLLFDFVTKSSSVSTKC